MINVWNYSTVFRSYFPIFGDFFRLDLFFFAFHIFYFWLVFPVFLLTVMAEWSAWDVCLNERWARGGYITPTVKSLFNIIYYMLRQTSLVEQHSKFSFEILVYLVILMVFQVFCVTGVFWCLWTIYTSFIRISFANAFFFCFVGISILILFVWIAL